MEINKVLDMNCSGKELEIKELLKEAFKGGHGNFRLDREELELLNLIKNKSNIPLEIQGIEFGDELLNNLTMGLVAGVLAGGLVAGSVASLKLHTTVGMSLINFQLVCILFSLVMGVVNAIAKASRHNEYIRVIVDVKEWKKNLGV